MDSRVVVIVVVAVLVAIGIVFWLRARFSNLPVTFTTLFRDPCELEAGDSVWSFEGGKWKLLEDRSAPGFAPGPQPTEPGQFDGYCVRVISVRSPKA